MLLFFTMTQTMQKKYMVNQVLKSVNNMMPTQTRDAENVLKNFRKSQHPRNRCLFNTYLSQHKPYNRPSSQSRFRNQNFTFTLRPRFFSYDNCWEGVENFDFNPHFKTRSRSITPNIRKNTFPKPQETKYHQLSIDVPQRKPINTSRNSPRSNTPLLMVNQVVDNLEKTLQAASSKNADDEFLN